MTDDLRRAFEFMERGDIGGLHTEHTRLGTLHADPRHPRRSDSNYHAVDRLPEEVSADELEGDVERAQAAVGRSRARKQMIDAKHGIAERVSVRCFAVLVDGEVASYTDLYQDGAVAQIEDAATSEQHQRRGYASAVVTKAVEEARAAGAELIFLVTDAGGRAQQLLGFDAIGGYVNFRRSA
jgi:ribosomal protein S18 acetylase RimI-like enzyme